MKNNKRILLSVLILGNFLILSCNFKAPLSEDEKTDSKFTISADQSTITRGNDTFSLYYNENFDDPALTVDALLQPNIDGNTLWHLQNWFGGSKSGLEINNGHLEFYSFRGKVGDDRYQDVYHDSNSKHYDGGGFLNGSIFFQAQEPYGFYETRLKFNSREYSGGWGVYYAYWHDNSQNITKVYEYDFVEEHKVKEFDITTHWQSPSKPFRRSLTRQASKLPIFAEKNWETINQWHTISFLWTPERCAIYYNKELIYIFYEDNRNKRIPPTYVATSRKDQCPLISDKVMMFLIGAASSNTESASSWVEPWTGYPTLPLFGTAPENYRYKHVEMDYFKYYKYNPN